MITKKLMAFFEERFADGDTAEDIDQELRSHSHEMFGRAVTRVDLITLLQSLHDGVDLDDDEDEDDVADDTGRGEEEHCDDCSELLEDCTCDEDGY